MFILLFTFFLSCISHFAQYYQLLIDTEEINKLKNGLPTNVKNELTSPNSGMIRLPAPSSLPTTVNCPHPKGKIVSGTSSTIEGTLSSHYPDSSINNSSHTHNHPHNSSHESSSTTGHSVARTTIEDDSSAMGGSRGPIVSSNYISGNASTLINFHKTSQSQFNKKE